MQVTKLSEPKQHVLIFVASTFKDLKPYRDAVRDAIQRLEHIVKGMEYFGSKPGSPKEESLKVVGACKVFIGVFAMRYGSLDEETGKSITHLEYDEAQRLKLPTLIYLLDEENEPVLPGHVDTGDNADKLRALKDELKRRFTVSFFTTPEDLARRISQDLPGVLGDLSVHVDEERTVDGDVGESCGVAPTSASLVDVSCIPGADAETWYAVQPARVDVEATTWAHCVCRLTNRSTAVVSVARTQVLFDRPAGEPVQLHLSAKGTDAKFRATNGGRVTVNLSEVRPGAVRVEREGQIIPVHPGVPVDLEIVAKADIEFEHGFRAVDVTVVLTEQSGHETRWAAHARHIETGPPPTT
jgi:hypothetical protein